MPTTYATLADLKARLGIADSNTAKDVELQDRLDSAADAIDAYCYRTFTKDTSATARWAKITPSGIQTDDFWSETGLVVTPYVGQTAGTAWDLVTYPPILEPLNGIEDGISGFPYRRIAFYDQFYNFGLFANFNRVQVTAKWGWAAVPRNVELACLMLAAMDNKAGDAPFGYVSFGDYATKIRTNPMVEEKLKPFRKGGGPGLLVAS